MCNLHIWSWHIIKPFQWMAFLVLALFAGPVLAAETGVATFWTGFIDGFVSLIKLLLSPFFDVTLVVEDFGGWGYRMGYYLGVLTFAGVAGAAASSEPAQTGEVRWG